MSGELGAVSLGARVWSPAGYTALVGLCLQDQMSPEVTGRMDPQGDRRRGLGLRVRAGFEVGKPMDRMRRL